MQTIGSSGVLASSDPLTASVLHFLHAHDAVCNVQITGRSAYEFMRLDSEQVWHSRRCFGTGSTETLMFRRMHAVCSPPALFSSCISLALNVSRARGCTGSRYRAVGAHPWRGNACRPALLLFDHRRLATEMERQTRR